MSRPYSLALDVPTTLDAVGTPLTVYHLKEKVVQIYDLPSGEYQVQISADGAHYQDYGGTFTAPGFLGINFYAFSVRVKCVAAGSATMLIAGVQQS